MVAKAHGLVMAVSWVLDVISDKLDNINCEINFS
jgi:hypothetical protein